MADKELDILSNESTSLALTVNSSLCMIISAFGIVANIINIIVFSKLGFSDTSNISLTALALSDLGCLTTDQWINVSGNPSFVSSGVPWVISDIVYLTVGCLHASFGRITSWITAFITLEKCLCVIVPFKVKRIMTSAVTKTSMVTIYIAMLLLHLPDYATLYFDWKFVPERNQTLLGIIPRQNSIRVEFLSFLLIVLFQIISFLAVIIFTIILVLKMRLNFKWRKEAVAGSAEAYKNHQKRNDRTVKMILVVAIIYIICFLPAILVVTSSVVVQDLSVSGKFRNGFLVVCSVVFTTEAINSSANIFVYYTVSSKYRATFDHTFWRNIKQV